MDAVKAIATATTITTDSQYVFGTAVGARSVQLVATIDVAPTTANCHIIVVIAFPAIAAITVAATAAALGYARLCAR